MKELTLALIKPDGMPHMDEIFSRIAEAHLHVKTQTETTLTKEQAESFYAEHRGIYTCTFNIYFVIVTMCVREERDRESYRERERKREREVKK